MKTLTIEEFLKLPETEPACEYINGEIVQKPMPKTRHSRLQGKFISTINNVVEEPRIAYSFPELRCTFGGRSIVPDIAVLRWGKIPIALILSLGKLKSKLFLPKTKLPLTL